MDLKYDELLKLKKKLHNVLNKKKKRDKLKLAEEIKEADEVDEFDNNRLKVTGVYYIGPEKKKKEEVIVEDPEDLVSDYSQ